MGIGQFFVNTPLSPNYLFSLPFNPFSRSVWESLSLDDTRFDILVDALMAGVKVVLLFRTFNVALAWDK